MGYDLAMTSPTVRESFDGQDRNFSQISSCGSAKRSPHRLRRFR